VAVINELVGFSSGNLEIAATVSLLLNAFFAEHNIKPDNQTIQAGQCFKCIPSRKFGSRAPSSNSIEGRS
jgi:hypothetical protein